MTLSQLYIICSVVELQVFLLRCSSSAFNVFFFEYHFCPTSDTLPSVIEPDAESQSGDALPNAPHLVQIWRGLHNRYCLTSFSIPESP